MTPSAHGTICGLADKAARMWRLLDRYTRAPSKNTASFRGPNSLGSVISLRRCGHDMSSDRCDDCRQQRADPLSNAQNRPGSHRACEHAAVGPKVAAGSLSHLYIPSWRYPWLSERAEEPERLFEARG
jgi:hypothetical protein